MRLIVALLLASALTACVPVHAAPHDTFPNIVVPSGPAGHLTGIDVEGVDRDPCAPVGTLSYCIDGFKKTLERDLTRLFSEYFKGEGPAFRAKLTVNRFEIGERGNSCGRGSCGVSIPVLEWRFELVREDTGDKPLRIALTTYGHRGFTMGVGHVKGRDEAAESLIGQMVSAINARLWPAK